MSWRRRFRLVPAVAMAGWIVLAALSCGRKAAVLSETIHVDLLWPRLVGGSAGVSDFAATCFGARSLLVTIEPESGDLVRLVTDVDPRRTLWGCKPYDRPCPDSRLHGSVGTPRRVVVEGM